MVRIASGSSAERSRRFGETKKRVYMGDFPIYETLLCELVGHAAGLMLGFGIGHIEFGWVGGIIGILLGVTVVPLCVRLPRMRRDFVTVFDVFEAVGLMCGLTYGLTFGLGLRIDWWTRIRWAIIAALAGWFCAWLPCFLWRCYVRIKLTMEATDALRLRLSDRVMWPLYEPAVMDEKLLWARLRLSAKWPIYPLVMRELRKRGEDLRSELPLVLMLLCGDPPERRHRGMRMLRNFFPDLASKIPDYDAWQTTAECRAKAESIRSVDIGPT